MSETNIERLPRFIRHRFRKPTFVLQERDREVVRIVSQHRVISSDDLLRLIDGSNQTALRRLQKLFHNGYLDRPRSQRQFGNVPMIYAVGQHGAELLAQEAGEQTKTDWSEKNRRIGAAYLEHALMVSRFQAALRFALRIHGGAILERWISDGGVRDSVEVQHDTGRERIPIAPDAFFTLRLLNEPEGRNRVHVFLEADRGTMTTKRFVANMLGYWWYWRSGKQEERCGIKNALVLTITKTPERAVNLCAATRVLDAPKHRGLRVFLFGSENSYSEPKQILASIWATPADNDRHSILE